MTLNGVFQGLSKVFKYPKRVKKPETGKAMDFKFGLYIHRVHPNKSPLKMLKKRERGRNQGLPTVLKYPCIISGTGKATDLKFGRYIQRIHPNKSPLKILEKRERGRI